MKKLIYLIIAVSLFMFVFFDSNTWESYKVTEKKRGLEFISVKHRLRWNRFFSYIRNVPTRILESELVDTFLSRK